VVQAFIHVLFHRATNGVSLDHCSNKGYLEAYASMIQKSTRDRRDRVSLEWRFLDPMQNDAVHVVESLRGLSGLNTIAFQIKMSRELRETILQLSKDTFLKGSDNYHVRIDEIHTFAGGNSSTTPMHRSTLIIKGNELVPEERRVHEHVYSYPSSRRTDADWTSNISSWCEWETLTVRI
jgi:hypothetical protein